MRQRQLITENDAHAHGSRITIDPETQFRFQDELQGLGHVPDYVGEGEDHGDIDFMQSDVRVVVNALVRYRDPLDHESRNLAMLRAGDGRWSGVEGYAMGRGSITPLTTVMTELHEETGVPPTMLEHVALGGMDEYWLPSGVQLLVAKALVQLRERPVIVLNDEHTEFAWHTDESYTDMEPTSSLTHAVHTEFMHW